MEGCRRKGLFREEKEAMAKEVTKESVIKKGVCWSVKFQ